MDETNDDFNDDTFGGEEVPGGKVSKSIGKDFDFFGQTAKVSDAINEEQMRFSRQQILPKPVPTVAPSLPKQATKPMRSGYEKYQEPTRNLQVDPGLWGAPAQSSPGLNYGNGPPNSYGHSSAQQPPSYTKGPSRKMMSLEEVEAQMRSQTKKAPSAQAIQHQGLPKPANQIINKDVSALALEQTKFQHQQQSQDQVDSRQATVPLQHPQIYQASIAQAELPATVARSSRVLQRPQSMSQNIIDPDLAQPRQILQNPIRHQAPSGSALPAQSQGSQHQSRFSASGSSGAHYSQQIITHPQQFMQLSEEERAAFLVEDAKRAKRNHKIYLLSKDNGLMTPQDKNFITRIQLQQLMTTTGNVNEQDPDAALSEDFYYQVHSQIRGGPRQNPHQPLSQFAQTYLFQTGGRQGGFSRRNNRVGDNHMQRMEQQVQRAVEAAKLKPKNKQLVIEGSLGKISFSNAKTPKPLLNIKRNDSGDVSNRPHGPGRNSSTRKVTQTEMSASDRKSVLRNIEDVYSTLMKIEDAMRREQPLPMLETYDVTGAEDHQHWLKDKEKLNESLWNELRVMEPINPESSIPHPFIAFLSYAKGKKAIPRVFRHLIDERRVRMMTIIIFHLDILDVVRLGQLRPGETQLPPVAREAIELFSAAVIPSLFSYVSDASLYYVTALLGLILDRVNVQAAARTRVGLNILTMLTSRATLIRETGEIQDVDWQNWSQLFNRLFDILEPSLDGIFPGSLNTGEDIYVWQFLAAIGSGASPEQQQRLVLAVK